MKTHPIDAKNIAKRYQLFDFEIKEINDLHYKIVKVDEFINFNTLIKQNNQIFSMQEGIHNFANFA